MQSNFNCIEILMIDILQSMNPDVDLNQHLIIVIN